MISYEHCERLEAKIAEANSTLLKLEHWFDVDEEFLVQMNPDERADHCRQVKLISDTLQELSKG